MKIIFFCILKLIFISIASSQSVPLGFICEFAGKNGIQKDLPFDVSDLPARCNVVSYGGYYFDGTFDDGPMIKSDVATINKLVAAGVSVYFYVGYLKTNNWGDILDYQDKVLYDELVVPLIDKINKLKVSGIILTLGNLYYGLPDLDNKISTFVKALKDDTSPALKFGLNVLPAFNNAYDKIPNKEIFDYSITNAVIDIYMIDLYTGDLTCTPQISKDGTLISSPDKTVVTMELLSDSISQSNMDQAKTVGTVIFMPITSNGVAYNPYSEYCNTTGAAGSGEWCLDHPKKLYDIGVFLKTRFAGLAVDWLEFDDVQGLCQCPQEKYPVTNILFDGWDGAPLQPCPKMD